MPRQLVHAVFRAGFKQPMEAGIKTCTSRRGFYLGQVGDLFFVRGSLYEITARERLPLHKVAATLWRQEGASSAQDFEDIWKRIHGEWDGYEVVNVTHFRRVPVGTVLMVVHGGVHL